MYIPNIVVIYLPTTVIITSTVRLVQVIYIKTRSNWTIGVNMQSRSNGKKLTNGHDSADIRNFSQCNQYRRSVSCALLMYQLT